MGPAGREVLVYISLLESISYAFAKHFLGQRVYYSTIYMYTEYMYTEGSSRSLCKIQILWGVRRFYAVPGVDVHWIWIM